MLIIDGIELDELNEKFFLASELEKYNYPLIYLTGKAGTGKTTFLKYLRETNKKNKIILAPTGVAAINAGGQTIHSFFQIPFGPFVPNDKRLRIQADINDPDKSTIFNHFKFFKDRLEIIKGLELLVIDEISMVRCDLLDVIDRLLRVFRGKLNEPFGGVQVILIGDTFQLPPIADFEQWGILKLFYDSPFFFSSKVIQNNKIQYIELDKIYRQNEQEFIDLLNRVRVNQVTQNELKILNSKYDPNFSPNENENYITLATHNNIVDNTNLTNLSKLTSELKSFDAEITGIFPDNIMPTNKILQLKEGSQIMFIKNDTAKRYYNGAIAKIIKIEDNKITIEFSNGNKIVIEKQTWKNIKYAWNDKTKTIEEETTGTFTQFPIKLAWAITVHKSQGLTFEKVIADLGGAFASGQVYVALSRCTSFSGLVLKTKIDTNSIKTDREVLDFAKNETPNTLILEELNSGKADFFYKQSREAFKNLSFEKSYDCFLQAIKFRNDIDTKSFKKVFITYSSKLSLYISKYKSKSVSLESSLANNLKLESSLNELNSANEIHKSSIAERDKSIKLLLDKINEIELINENKKNENFNLNIINNKNENLIRTYLASIQDYKNKTIELQEKIYTANNEIERLNKLKWYHKIVGKK
ncbi:MAG: DEAD/DEAH box helicase [Bacteroidota bacterium]|nr:DEAD/DEAH box helicase [Bacteroidota bacterium]